jgi:hypothetical protein
MAQTQIQLANTFNEFRSAYNNAANTLDSLETTLNSITGGGGGGGGQVTVGTVTSNNFIGNGFTENRILFANGAGYVIGDDGLIYFPSSNTLSLQNNLLLGNTLYATGSVLANTIGANTLTSGRIAFVGSGGVVVDDADLAWDTSTNRLTLANGQLNLSGTTSLDSAGKIDVNNTLRAANVTANNLTSGRVLIAGTSGLISDDSGLTYNSGTDSLTASGNITATAWANAANINVTNDVLVGANVNVSGTVNAASDLHVGGAAQWIIDKDESQDVHLVTAVAESDGAHDIAVVNRSNSVNAYAELIAINNAGNTDNGWVSIGINATNYNQGAFAVTKGDDAYILYNQPVGSTKSGDLVIGTGGNGTGNKIIFSANGFDDPANNTQMTIEPGVRIHIEVPTQSTSTTSGALTVAGGIGVVGNMNVGGNVTITGSISLLGAGNTVSTDTLAVANSMLFLANGNSSDALDIGVVGQYQQGAPKYFGLVRDQSDGIFKLFLDASTRPANTVNFGEAGLNYGSVQIGELFTSNTTATSSSSTGSLRVAGGAGVAGGIWAGGAIRTDDITASTSTSTGALIIAGGAGIAGNTIVGGAIVTTDSTASSSTSTGSIRSSGGAGIAGAVYAGGVLVTTDTTASTSTSSGSLRAGGGAGIAGAVYAGGVIVTSDTTASSSTTTGSLRVGGGAGIAGAVYAGGAIVTSDATDTTSGTTGAVQVAGGIGVAKGVHVGGTLITTKVSEKTSDVTGNGVTTFNTANGHVFAVTPSANFTANFTNVDTTSSRVQVMTLIITQGGTKYDLSAVQIGGAAQTIKWAGGVAPTFTANRTELVVITLIRTSAGAWTVTGQLSQYS